MKVLVVLAAVVACTLAEPGLLSYGLFNQLALTTPYTVSSPVAISAPAITSTQYHAQNELGEAKYGYAQPGQAHNAARDAFGNVAGSYSYVAPNGQLFTTNYIADTLGYRVASNALPVGPSNIAAASVVQDTPEVQAARAAHLAAVAQVRSRSKRQVLAYPGTSAVAYSNPAAVAYSSPAAVAYSNPAAVAYSSPAAVAYSNPAAVAYSSPAAYSTYAAPAVSYSALPYSAVTPVSSGIPATLTTLVNNPGHAVSYRVD